MYNNRKNTIEPTFPPDFLVHIIIFPFVSHSKRIKKNIPTKEKELTQKTQRANKPVGDLSDAHRDHNRGGYGAHIAE